MPISNSAGFWVSHFPALIEDQVYFYFYAKFSENWLKNEKKLELSLSWTSLTQAWPKPKVINPRPDPSKISKLEGRNMDPTHPYKKAFWKNNADSFL